MEFKEIISVGSSNSGHLSVRPEVVAKSRSDLQKIAEAQLKLSTLMAETLTQVLVVARQVEHMATKKTSASSKPVRKIMKQKLCGFCKKQGHLKKKCRRKNGLCLICGAAEHQLVNCPRWVPRSKEKKTGIP